MKPLSSSHENFSTKRVDLGEVSRFLKELEERDKKKKEEGGNTQRLSTERERQCDK